MAQALEITGTSKAGTSDLILPHVPRAGNDNMFTLDETAQGILRGAGKDPRLLTPRQIHEFNRYRHIDPEIEQRIRTVMPKSVRHTTHFVESLEAPLAANENESFVEKIEAERKTSNNNDISARQHDHSKHLQEEETPTIHDGYDHADHLEDRGCAAGRHKPKGEKTYAEIVEEEKEKIRLEELHHH